MNAVFRQPGKTGKKIKKAERSAGFVTRKNCTISLDNKKRNMQL